VAGLLAAAGLITACGGKSSPNSTHTGSVTGVTGTTGGGGGGNTSQPSCRLAPASLVNTALGTDLGDPTEQINGPVTVCQYVGKAAGHVTVRFETGQSASIFQQVRKSFDDNGQPTKDVHGFADEAFSSTIGTANLTLNTLVARQGPVEILVTSKSSIGAEQTLEMQLFAKF